MKSLQDFFFRNCRHGLSIRIRFKGFAREALAVRIRECVLTRRVSRERGKEREGEGEEEGERKKEGREKERERETRGKQ